MIGQAAVLGWAPAELYATSFSDYSAAVEGFIRYQRGSAASSSDESVQRGADLLARVERKNRRRARGRLD